MSNLIPYAILATIVGVVALLFSARVGILYGDSESRIDDYMIKDTALFITSLHALPGNLVLNFFYPIYERRLSVNASHVSIFNLEDENVQDFFWFRTIGTENSNEFIFERSQEFDISKSDTEIGINVNPNLDALPCIVQYDKNEIDSIEFYYTNFDGERTITENLAISLRNSLTRNFNVMEEIRNVAFGISGFETDLSIIISSDFFGSNDFVAYVHHKNRLGQEVSCRIINRIMSDQNIDGSNFMVYSIDPDLYEMEGLRLDEKTIFFRFGSSDALTNNAPRIRSIITNVLEVYK